MKKGFSIQKLNEKLKAFRWVNLKRTDVYVKQSMIQTVSLSACMFRKRSPDKQVPKGIERVIR